jgi:hypothetical protein
MKASAIFLYNRIFDFFHARCNTKEYLLNQDCRYGSQTSQLELDGTVDEGVVISILNGGLGPNQYFRP